jgi:hypothetical protein
MPYTSTRALKSHPHYTHDLSGPVEDSIASMMGPFATQANALEGFKMFVFGTTNINKDERHKRARAHNVTKDYDKVVDAAKLWVIGPQASFTAPKNLKADERETIYEWTWKQWKDAWKKAGFPNKAALSREDIIEQAKVEAKAAATERAIAIREKGKADAQAGTYAPPKPPASGPDYNLALYQLGWTSVKSLPAGVAPAAVPGGALSPQSAGGGGAGPAGAGGAGLPVVPIAIAVAVAAGALLFLRKKG